MKLFLLSDLNDLNKNLKSKLCSEIESLGNNIAYISSSPQEPLLPWFNNMVQQYKNINSKTELKYFDLSEKYSDEDLKEILNFNIIHLSGGNTFQFLDFIRKRNFKKIIDEFRKDKLIIGTSAGSIILTPTIEIALDEDENFVGMTNFTGLNYVDFEFFPHYNFEKLMLNKIKDYYSKHSANTIYLASDNDGIFVDNDKVTLFGNIIKI